MALLQPGNDLSDGRLRLFGSNALLDFIVKLAILAGAIVFNTHFAGLYAPVLMTSLVQARGRIKRRWFPPDGQDSAVREALRVLPDDYNVVDGLQLPDGKGRLDHLVVGPNGLFAIEGLSHPGEIKCEGYEWYVDRRRIPSLSRHAKHKAIAVRNILADLSPQPKQGNYSVVGVVAITNPGAVTKLFQPAVPVLRVEELAGFIRSHKPAGSGRAPQTGEEMRAIVSRLESLRPKAAASRLLTFFGLS